MKKTAAIVGAAMGILVLIVVLSQLAQPREPEFQGKNLSQWLDQWADEGCNLTNTTADAIHAIGSNAIPMLISWVSEEPSAAELTMIRFATRYIPESANFLTRDYTRNVIAAKALNLLGTNAQSTFPVLTNLMKARQHRFLADIALAGMGSNGIAVLTNALTNGSWDVRSSAAMALGQARSDFDIVVPALVAAMKIKVIDDGDKAARTAAGISLAELHRRPDLAVPAFAGFLTNHDPQVRGWAAHMLGKYGAEAKAAMPLLREAAKDASPQLRESAEDALNKINVSDTPTQSGQRSEH